MAALLTPPLASQLTLHQYVLNILGECNSLKHLKQLQAFLLTQGHGQTDIYAFKLIRFCAITLTDLDYARSIFDHLASPNIYLYTAMITAYASRPQDHSSALTLFRTMMRQGTQPNHFIYPHVLRCCHHVLEPHGTEALHNQILKSGFGGYPVVQTALVDSYSRFSSNIYIARILFDEISEKSVVSWTAMMSGYTRVGEMGNAISIFERMPERDVPSWNAVIGGCAQNGLFSEAISLFRKMVNATESTINRPNQVTVACALSAFGHMGMLQLGKCIHGYIYRNVLGSDSYISNALVDMYGKCGSWREATMMFDRTSMKSLTLWNSMINCYALHGQSMTAIGVFDEMMRCGYDTKPDEVTFVGLLNACTHGGLVEKGCSYFNLMTHEYGIEPQIQHYGCLIDLLGRAGQFKEAMEVIKGMRIAPDEVIWGSLLNSCKIYGHMDLAEVAIKKLIEIDPNNGGYGTMLANLYGELSNWDEVRKVRKMLKQQDAHKTPGCSWIEVDNQVNQFYSADKTHPQTEEIYMTLESLLWLLLLV